MRLESVSSYGDSDLVVLDFMKVEIEMGCCVCRQHVEGFKDSDVFYSEMI